MGVQGHGIRTACARTKPSRRSRLLIVSPCTTMEKITTI